MKLKMNKQRQVSGIAIALLMIALVIGVGLSTPVCYAPEPPYNETDAKEFDPDDLPWDNETDIIILPWDNETAINERLDNIERMLVEMRDVVDDIKYGLFGARVIHRPTITPDPVTNETDVVITDPLEELNLRIDYLDTNLQDLTEEFSILQTVYDEHLGLYNVIVEDLYSEIDVLIFKQSKLRTDIQYAYLAIVVMIVVMALGGWAITKDLAAKIRKTSEAGK